MLPPASMLAIKNRFRNFPRFVVVVAAMLTAGGCTPPGPGALLEGARLLEKGKYSEAVEQLKAATEMMPQNPRAWNHLGLAYHAAGQPQSAALAYKQALALDRSNVVHIAHYNLGCLYLEQTNLPAAIDQLRSFTMLTNSVPALNKLGTAQYLARLPDAEKTFATALRLRPRDPEALNGMGLVQSQRGRVREAAQMFNAAVLSNPGYGPALLNLAVISQQQPASRPVALQKYREYLALKPRPSNWEAVNANARQLELELAPPPRPAVTNIVAGLAPLKTNVVVVASVVPPVIVTSAPPRVAIVTSTPPVVVVSPPVTTVVLTNPPIVRPPTSEVAVLVTDAPRTNLLVAAAPMSAGTDRPGFFARLNPFQSKPKPATNVTRPPVLVAASTVTNTFVPTPRPVEVPRYKYLSPARPTAGNRAEAERAYQRALQAQQAGRVRESLVAFREASVADPAWYDAHYGLGLAAYQTGDWKQALSADETALALNPGSIDARANFALALKQAGYPRDAANELEKLLQARPEDARAHLMLGNLYAQQLGQPRLARDHYLKVLQLDPRNEQSGPIRFWLSTNP